MWTILVVVGDELAQDQRQVVFIQHDEVVQALAPQRPDDTFHDRAIEATEQASLWRRCRCVVHADGSCDRRLDRDHGADGEACDPMASPQSLGATPTLRLDWPSRGHAPADAGHGR